MLCPKCQFSNTADAKFCLVCGTPLFATVSSNNSGSPFEGFTPDWLAGSNNFANSTQDPNFDTFAANSHEPVFHEPVSIEDLLRDSTVINNAAASNKSSYIPSSSSGIEPPPFDVSITGNKISPLQPSPRNYALVASDATNYAPPTYVPLPANPYVPADGSHISGVYKGCFYYPDGFGETIVVPLAGFWVRLKAAAIDYFVSYCFSLLFWILANIILNLLLNGMRFAGMDVNPINVPTQFSTFDEIMVFLAISARNEVIPFLYYVLMIGMSGQTFGMRWSDIRVVKKNDKPIGAFSAIVRALWGIIYFLVIVFISFFVTVQISTTPAIFATFFFLLSSFLTFISMVLVIVWMLLDKGKQAMNDKLAGTYVVKTTELTRF